MAGNVRIDTFGLQPNSQVMAANPGWNLDPMSVFRYGLAYPWHLERVNVGRVGGGTAALSPSQLADGCDVKSNWLGLIKDSELYSWDLN
jgi:hypothetical protein